MISEKAVRITVSHISSEMVTSRLHMISSPIGSRSSSATWRSNGVANADARTRGALRCTVMTRFALASTVSVSPGGITVVASSSSTIRGPEKTSPGRSA
jgi:hypothetical protein